MDLLHILSVFTLFKYCIEEVKCSNQTMKMTVPCLLGTSCDLPCRMEPYYTNVNVLWFNDKKEILSEGTKIRKNHKNLKIEKPAYNEWTLRIFRVNRNYAGTYLCKTNDNYILSEITVVIEHEPKIDEENSSPIRESVMEMAVAKLRCIFSGTPEPKITWHRGKSEDLIDGIEGQKLILRDVQRYASDDYTCKATNKHGSRKRHIRLVVKFAPEVTLMEHEVYAEGAKEVSMGCIVQAFPIYDAYWTNHKEERITTELSFQWKYEVTVENETDIFPVRFLELRIKPHILSVNDAGNYTCHAIGDQNEAHSSLELKVNV